MKFGRISKKNVSFVRGEQHLNIVYYENKVPIILLSENNRNTFYS